MYYTVDAKEIVYFYRIRFFSFSLLYKIINTRDVQSCIKFEKTATKNYNKNLFLSRQTN